LKRPGFLVGLAGVIVAVVGGVFGSPAVLLAGVVTGVIGLLIDVAQKGKLQRQDDPADMGAEARWLLRPIRELREGLAKIVQQSASSPEVGVIAQEAIVEADGIYAKAIELVRAREGLKSLASAADTEGTQILPLEAPSNSVGLRPFQGVWEAPVVS